MLLIKGISILISLLYVPLLLDTFDATNYGIWLTLTSLVSWVALFDIGIGNGLRNKLAYALSLKDNQSSRVIVSTAYYSMLGIILALYLVFLFTYKYIKWNHILAGDSVVISNIDNIVLVVFCAFLLQFFFGLLNSILYAIQKPAISSLITTIGQLFSYLLVLVCVCILKDNSMLDLGAVISFTPPVVLFIATIILFKTTLKDLRPSIAYFRCSKIHELFSLGIQFFIIQIITIVLFQSNNLIITHILDSDVVVEYNVSYKYMNTLVIIFNIMATPIWSATTEAWGKHDIQWIKVTNKRLLKVVGGMAILGLIMLLVSPWVYGLWLKDKIEISPLTTFLIFIYTVFMMLYGSYGYILNGIGKLRIQIVATCLIACIYIPTTCFMGKLLGLPGILMSFALTAVLNLAWSRLQYKKLMSGKAKGIWIR